MSISEYRGRGRPSAYRPLLKRIREISGSEWHPVRNGLKNGTVYSALRVRYPDFDFRCVPDGRGTYTVEARYIGE